MKIYMEVTKDEYQLPVTIADSPKKLAEICGVDAEKIRASCYRHKTGRSKLARFVSVEIEDKMEE